MAAWNGRDPLTNMYQNKCPKGQNNHAPHPGEIVIFAILTPLGEGGQNSHETGPGGLDPFGYIIRIDM